MKQAFSRQQIEQSLRSAVDALTPDVSGNIDLSAPQIRESAVDRPQIRESAMDRPQSPITRLERRMRGLGLAAAACLCLFLAGGGAWYYQRQNLQVESVIGIDVNPSVELLINRREKVIEARPLNADAAEIMEDMDLEGVDLNVAVNAVVGSMVTHGYLDELDNAILVTVTNDSVSKARALRASVVQDIEASLQENQVDAVVYDQQVIEDEEISELAAQYGISYGKAYFLRELIDENPELDMADMETLSGMTLEEIAAQITRESLVLGELAEKSQETAAARETAEETLPPETEETSTEDPESAGEEKDGEGTGVSETESTEAVTEPAFSQTSPVTEPETEEEARPVREDQVEIDFVDYEDGEIFVYFVTRVRWKNPTVSIRDEEGNSYAAMVDDTSGDECVIEAPGLEPGRSYTFVLGGLTPVETGIATTITGYFDTPEIAAGAETEEADEDEDADTGKEADEEADRDAGEDTEAAGADRADGAGADGDSGESTGNSGSGSEPDAAQPEDRDAGAGGEQESNGDAGREPEAGQDLESGSDREREPENRDRPEPEPSGGLAGSEMTEGQS